MYQYLIRPMLFAASKRDAERAHERALSFLRWLGSHATLCWVVNRTLHVSNPRLQQEVWGLRFEHPLGLAAGFDKNGAALPGLAAMGFSHIEVGTVTPEAQSGNPRPRLFRYPKDRALINRMGFNNVGAEAVKLNLSSLDVCNLPLVPISISLGKGRETPLEEASADYQKILETLFAYGDYFVVNVSSPNTTGLRVLQGKTQLDTLLWDLNLIRDRYNELRFNLSTFDKPLLVKISPDMSRSELDDVVEVCLARRVDGLIAVNTTTARAGLRECTDEFGGLSGRPLQERAVEVISYLHQNLPVRYPIIGVGGLMDAADAFAMLKAGATLLQSYTGFVYGGPWFVREVNRGLRTLMRRDGYLHVSQIHSGEFGEIPRER